MKFRKIFIEAIGLYLIFVTATYAGFYVGSDPIGASVTLNGFPRSAVKSIIMPFAILKKIMEGDRNEVENALIPDGVVYDEKISAQEKYKNLDLLTAYAMDGEINIELLDLQFGKTIKKWTLDRGKITDLTRRKNKSLPDHWHLNNIVHPLMLKDSSVIFGTWESAVKINANSEIEWLRNDYKAHHSIEEDHEGKVWLSARRNLTRLKGVLRDNLVDKEKMHFTDDLIVKIDPTNGDILFEKSVIELLTENNLGSMIYGDGSYTLDPIHLNDIQPAHRDGKYWKKGDLLLSFRHLSAIALYRPSENKVLWYKRGPWISQHDPDFVDDDKISVFGNQIFVGKEYYMDSKFIKNPAPLNSVFVYHFSNDSITEPYAKFIASEKIKTITEGRSEILPNGDLFIEETNFGRIYIGDTLSKKMSFSRRINETHIASLYWSRLIKN